MAANVWMRILPAQRKDDRGDQRRAKAGRETRCPGQAPLKAEHFHGRAVVFLMISNHFGGSDRRLRLDSPGGVDSVGWLAAKFIRRA